MTEIVGASRTDSGAHARGQVVHFDDLDGVPIQNWVRAMNDALPPDVAVKAVSYVAADFNSRFSARDRFYRYRILTSVRDPHRTRYAHVATRDLNVALMEEAAAGFVGRKDFAMFSQGLELGTNTVREIFSTAVHRVRDEVWIDVVGTAFLRGMMRRIAGSLFEVGVGRRSVQSVVRLFDSNEDTQALQPVLLPACGLCLMRIRYGRHPFDHRLKKTDRTQDNEDNE